jgi:hypothetical protein
MNDERKIAQALIEAHKLHEDSYVFGEEHSIGNYTRTMESCLIEVCKKQGLSKNLWSLLALAMQWRNDVQLWAEDVLDGKDMSSCCDFPSKERCE